MNEEIVWSGRFLNMIVRNGWEFVRRKKVSGIAGIIPLKDDGKLVLVEQFRPPLGKNVISFPAGLAGDEPGSENETLQVAAERELFEETGYQATSMKELFTGTTSCGLCDELMTFFLATGLQKTGCGGGNNDESIIVHEVDSQQIIPWLKAKEKQGILVDIKLYGIISKLF
ncbi:MAG: NUDIX hydrolase [Victivallaceae bacterium]